MSPQTSQFDRECILSGLCFFFRRRGWLRQGARAVWGRSSLHVIHFSHSTLTWRTMVFTTASPSWKSWPSRPATACWRSVLSSGTWVSRWSSSCFSLPSHPQCLFLRPPLFLSHRPNFLSWVRVGLLWTLVYGRIPLSVQSLQALSWVRISCTTFGYCDWG